MYSNGDIYSEIEKYLFQGQSSLRAVQALHYSDLSLLEIERRRLSARTVVVLGGRDICS